MRHPNCSYKVNPTGNAAGAFNQKQAQGHGQGGSWYYMTIRCDNTANNCLYAVQVFADISPSNSPLISPSHTPTANATSSSTPTPSGTASETSTPPPTATRSPSPTGTGSKTARPSGSPTKTGKPTTSSSRSGSPEPTGSPTASGTAAGTASATGTPSSSLTAGASSSGTGSPSPSASVTPPSSETGSTTGTPSPSQTGTASTSLTRTPARTRSSTGSPSGTPTASAPETESPSASATAGSSATGTPAASPSASSAPAAIEPAAVLFGMAMPIPDARVFTSSPALALALRSGLACSIGLPLQQVQLNSTRDTAGATVFFTEAHNGGEGGCDSRRRLRAQPAATAQSPYPMHKLRWVTSLAELGPGRAIWFHDALAELASSGDGSGSARRLPAVAARRLQAPASGGVSVRLVIPAEQSPGASIGDVTGRQQDAASSLVTALNSVQSSEALGGSSPLLDSLSSAGFLDAYSSSTGVNPVDLAAALTVSEPVVDVPSVTGTSTTTASQTASSSATATGSSSATGTASPSSSGTRSSSATGTRSPSATGTSSSSATGTSSPSGSGTGSSSATGTSSPSGSGTGSSSATGTSSPSGSGTGSPSATSTPPPLYDDFASLAAWPVAAASGDGGAPAPPSYPGAAIFFAPAGGLVFPAHSPAGGRELWSMSPDGGAPASPAWDLLPGPGGSEPDEMSALSAWATGSEPVLLLTARASAGAAPALHAWVGGGGGGGERCAVALATPLTALRRPVSTANGLFFVGTPASGGSDGSGAAPRVWRLPREALAAGALCAPHAPVVAMSQPTPAEPLSRLEHCGGQVLFLGRALPSGHPGGADPAVPPGAVGLWRLAVDGSGAAFTPLPASAQPAPAADGQLLANPRCVLGGTAVAFATAAGPVALVAPAHNGNDNNATAAVTLLASDALGVGAYSGAQALAAVGGDGLCFVASLAAVGGTPPRGALLCWSPSGGLAEAAAGPAVDAPAVSWALGTPTGHVYLPCAGRPGAPLRACAYHAPTRTWAATPAGVTLSYSSFTSHGGRLYFAAAASGASGAPVLFTAPLLA